MLQIKVKKIQSSQKLLTERKSRGLDAPAAKMAKIEKRHRGSDAPTQKMTKTEKRHRGSDALTIMTHCSCNVETERRGF
ncbi:hypothetical protein AHAS_Ahas15G0159500 [Arachis hypogaea]